MFIQLEGSNGILYLNVAQISHVEFIRVDLTYAYAQIYMNGWQEPIHIKQNVPGYATIETWCKAWTNR